MKLSVVIPTYKRDKYVLNTLKALEQQNFKDFEIILVTQSKVELKELEEFIKKNKRIRFFEMYDKTGATYSRNLGIEEARGDIILFLDDDIEIQSKDFLHHHLKNYDKKEVGGVVGRLTEEGFPPPDEDLEPGKITKTGKFIVNYNSTKKLFVMGGPTGNLSIQTEILRKIGGFDENFKRSLREDSDLTMRVYRMHKFVFEPEAYVHHLNAPSGGMESRYKQEKGVRLNWYRNFFHNEILFFLKHLPHIYLPIFIFYRKLRPILACMFWYGKASPRALITPLLGFLEGYKTYRMEVNTKSKWL